MRILWVLLTNLWVLLRWPWLAYRRAHATPHRAWLHVVIDGTVVEIGRRLSWWERAPHAVSIHAIRDVITLARDDDRVLGMLVTIRKLHAGSATAASLRQALLELKAAGKGLVAYLPDGAATRELYVASAADSVLVGPETEVAALGFAVEVQHIKHTLDWVGVEPEIFARGQYKTAAEFMSSRAMSDAQREQLGALLDTAYDSFVQALSEGRRRDHATVQAWIDCGPWSAREAVSQGIVDGIVYDDEIPRNLDPSSSKGAALVPAGVYRARRRIPWQSLRTKAVIAVVHVHGAIVSRADGMLPVADAASICQALDLARESRAVRGLIVHIDSRGGSAMASDRILHAIRRVREEKPVIACMGDVAASGGYMAAVGADTIIAQPTTITGSIGVIAAKLVAERLLVKLGISTSVLKRGARADMMSPSRHLEAGERDALERYLDASYRSFLEAVAQGRKKAVEEIEPLAGGRVWSGKDAASRELVDVLGGLDVAISRMRERLGTAGAGAEAVVVGGKPVRDLMSLLPHPFGAAASALARAGVPHVALWAGRGARDRVWAWCDVVESDD